MSFEKRGRVSIWIGTIKVDPDADFLVNQFAATDYDLDFQDCIIGEHTSPISDLIAQLSYADSFCQEAVDKAATLGISEALWILAQYDYEYEPSRSGLSSIPSEPYFLGCFSWHD
jgi:hypothetical protein